ncbi:MAG: outer membrane protein [Paracoccaceae bacterium]
MKALTLAAALAALTTPALAGGPTVVADDPMPAAMAAPAAAHDWSGPYVGLSYGRTTADIDFSTTGPFDFNDGKAVGLHAGYLLQRGQMVYGGEIAFGRVKDSYVPGGFGNDDEITKYLDLKARVGFAANRALFYGVLGYSQATYDEYAGVGVLSSSSDFDGLAVGIGADFAISQSLSLGMEYLSRNLSGDYEGVAGATADVNLDTLSLRVGLSF